MKITCTEFEILLADGLDGALAPDDKARLDVHSAGCTACAELARDAAGAVALMERVALVEPPPALVNRILLEATGGYSRAETRPSLLARLLGPVLQPRLALSMAMTVLSLAMLERTTGIEIRRMKPSDLNPASLLPAVEDRANRIWNRTVKEYENWKLIYDVQTRLQEWSGSAPEGAEQQ